MSKSTSGTYKKDTMISYNHNDKTLSHKIFEKLRGDEFDIWLDENEMYGSTMERMAEGVEQSEFLIICMSSTYAGSQACQSEATYAKGQKRLLFPIQVQKGFKPRGWLAILLADLFRVDFTKKEFDNAYHDLVN